MCCQRRRYVDEGLPYSQFYTNFPVEFQELLPPKQALPIMLKRAGIEKGKRNRIVNMRDSTQAMVSLSEVKEKPTGQLASLLEERQESSDKTSRKNEGEESEPDFEQPESEQERER